MKGGISVSETSLVVRRITELSASGDHILDIYSGDMHKPRNFTRIFFKSFCDLFHSNYQYYDRLISAH